MLRIGAENKKLAPGLPFKVAPPSRLETLKAISGEAGISFRVS
jgi:hypothetical protein